jgi:hypothetical protein
VLADGRGKLCAVRRDPQPRGADPRDRLRAEPSCLVGHRRDYFQRPCGRLVVQPAGLGEALAEPGDFGPIDHCCPLVVGGALGDEELDGVRADVDHREAPPTESGQRLEAAGHVDVAPRALAELAHGRDHLRGLLRLDGDRPSRAVFGAHLGQLCHGSADGVVLAPLVHVEGEQVRAPRDDLVYESLLRIFTIRKRRIDAERLQRRADVGG